MTKGAFLDFYLPYKDENGDDITYEDQAKKTLDKVKQLKGQNFAGVGLIYSANYGQTRAIEQTYFSKGWDTKTSGSNQAQTIMAIEDALGDGYSDLQGYFNINPISTMNAYVDPVAKWTEEIHYGILTTDLDRLTKYLDSGWVVLGWQNQDTKGSTVKPYAIGGRIANMSQSNSAYVQSRLKKLAKDYPMPSGSND